jgi:hypothetical protein
MSGITLIDQIDRRSSALNRRQSAYLLFCFEIPAQNNATAWATAR